MISMQKICHKDYTCEMRIFFQYFRRQNPCLDTAKLPLNKVKHEGHIIVSWDTSCHKNISYVQIMDALPLILEKKYNQRY